jgi:hypothetical protein
MGGFKPLSERGFFLVFGSLIYLSTLVLFAGAFAWVIIWVWATQPVLLLPLPLLALLGWPLYLRAIKGMLLFSYLCSLEVDRLGEPKVLDDLEDPTMGSLVAMHLTRLDVAFQIAMLVVSVQLVLVALLGSSDTAPRGVMVVAAVLLGGGTWLTMRLVRRLYRPLRGLYREWRTSGRNRNTVVAAAEVMLATARDGTLRWS